MNAGPPRIIPDTPQLTVRMAPVIDYLFLNLYVRASNVEVLIADYSLWSRQHLTLQNSDRCLQHLTNLLRCGRMKGPREQLLLVANQALCLSSAAYGTPLGIDGRACYDRHIPNLGKINEGIPTDPGQVARHRSEQYAGNGPRSAPRPSCATREVVKETRFVTHGA